MQRTVKITWKAFGNPTSAEIGFESMLEHEAICDMAYRATNLYSGAMWDILEPVLDTRRTHTALSVGDEVEVDGVTFRCERVGWAKI